jgi:pimeloyl-ACP methyl ester carboxylesterase
MQSKSNQQTTPGENPSLRVVKTNHGPIECLITGEGPALMTLHGAMGGWDQSDLLGRTVTDGAFKFINVTRPGYLGTPLSVGVEPEEQADAYAELLDALNINDVASLAISGGGPSAICFAIRHPERCRKLLLFSTCAGKVTKPLPLAFHVMKFMSRFPRLLKMMTARKGDDLEKSLSRSISDPGMLERVLKDPEVRSLLEELTAMTSSRADERIKGTLNDVRVTRTNDYELERITAPTLVVHGIKDPFLPFGDHGQALARRIPNAELLPVEGGEHVAIFTHRNLVRDRVTRFLNDSSSG